MAITSSVARLSNSGRVRGWMKPVDLWRAMACSTIFEKRIANSIQIRMLMLCSTAMMLPCTASLQGVRRTAMDQPIISSM